ncbi:TadE/TadG family type IV pilus assembly protein [Sphingomonas sp. URHD0057]|uniref:TadE/TadG family type IV pilus assembly protein n=1 Tax=Sphingomonas sp. URHD0057 TaxID=1380389 RepID=UPI0005693ED7|nr:TadE/TadG family type IV pilus assembly protein [Sphingomonas sp. URHD0057]
MIICKSFLGDDRGGGAVEFALVLPFLILMLFGVIDCGRWMFYYNMASKATQAGARVAAVTQIIPSGLAAKSFVGETVNGVVLTQGDVIPASALPTVTCSKPSGTLACSPVPAGMTLTPINANGWNSILYKMQSTYPGIGDANVRVEYRGSGVGYAGDPGGMDLSPLVTVRLIGLKFTPISSFLLANVNMPEFATTLTAEDAVGTVSN